MGFRGPGHFLGEETLSGLAVENSLVFKDFEGHSLEPFRSDSFDCSSESARDCAGCRENLEASRRCVLGFFIKTPALKWLWRGQVGVRKSLLGIVGLGCPSHFVGRLSHLTHKV